MLEDIEHLCAGSRCSQGIHSEPRSLKMWSSVLFENFVCIRVCVYVCLSVCVRMCREGR